MLTASRILYMFLSILFMFAVFPYRLDDTKAADFSYDRQRLVAPPFESGLNVTLIENAEDAWAVRMRLLEQAEERVQFSTYRFLEGEASELFISALLEAAMRGVAVDIIIDGMTQVHRFGSLSKHFEALIAHPNVTFKLYDPPRLRFLYAWQNRLHDKLLIIDETYALIGGRNIGDRYFFHQEEAFKTYDRDVLIWSDTAHSALDEMVAYFNLLFNQPIHNQLSPATNHGLESQQDAMIAVLQLHRDTLTIPWERFLNAAHAVDHAIFIRSPLTRGAKEPVVFNQISALAPLADDIVIQSPYIVLSSQMTSVLDDLNLQPLTLLTNHPYTNPNRIAASGYQRYRTQLASHHRLFEFDSTDSLHGKTHIFGSNITIIGSMNVDHRSTFLSTESALVIYSQSFNDEVRDAVAHLLAQSVQVNLDEEESLSQIVVTPSQRIALWVMGLMTAWFDEML